MYVLNGNSGVMKRSGMVVDIFNEKQTAPLMAVSIPKVLLCLYCESYTSPEGFLKSSAWEILDMKRLGAKGNINGPTVYFSFINHLVLNHFYVYLIVKCCFIWKVWIFSTIRSSIN